MLGAHDASRVARRTWGDISGTDQAFTVMSEPGDLTACLITTRVEPPSSIIRVFQVLKRENFAEGKYPANLAFCGGGLEPMVVT